MDSYCILTSSLKELCDNLEVNTKKYLFPFKFSNTDNLFYKGVIPSIDY